MQMANQFSSLYTKLVEGRVVSVGGSKANVNKLSVTGFNVVIGAHCTCNNLALSTYYFGCYSV